MLLVKSVSDFFANYTSKQIMSKSKQQTNTTKQKTNKHKSPTHPSVSHQSKSMCCSIGYQLTWWHDEHAGNRAWVGAESSQWTPAAACLAGIFHSQPYSTREGDLGHDPNVYGAAPKTQSCFWAWKDDICFCLKMGENVKDLW